MSNVSKTDILLVSAILVVLTLVCVGAFLASRNLEDVNGVLLGLQAAVTILAILVGGVLANRRLQIFRTFEPHLTITNKVSYRPIGESYVHVAVTATLHNSSKVKMEIREAFFRLQKIAPVSDDVVEVLYAEYAEAFEKREYKNIQWETLDEIPFTWDKDVVIVEPGEMHQETCELIVPNEVVSAIIYSYFYNSRVPQVPHGWGATTVLDMNVRESGSVDSEGGCNGRRQ